MTGNRNRFNFELAILRYCTIAFAWSWLFWGCSTLLRHQENLLPFGLGAIGSFGPGVAAIAVTGWQSGRAGIRTLLAQGLRWRFGWQWYLVILGLPPLVALLALGVHRLMGAAVPRWFLVNHGSLVPLSFLLLLLLGGPLGEEFGWRGFLLPRLQTRLNALWASIGIGVIWSFWHLPLFLIPGQLEQQLPFGLFLLNTIALSILLTWVFNSTGGSVLSAILLHTAVNYWSGVMPILPETAGTLRPFAIVVLLLWTVALLLVRRVGARHLTGWHRSA